MMTTLNDRETLNIAEREVRQRFLCSDAERALIDMQCRYFVCDVMILERARRDLVRGR